MLRRFLVIHHFHSISLNLIYLPQFPCYILLPEGSKNKFMFYLWVAHISKTQLVVGPQWKSLLKYLFPWMVILLYYVLLCYFHCCIHLVCISFSVESNLWQF